MARLELRYTVKIFSEGITEWHYFDSLRAIKRFNFTMEPAIPQNGKSSYKQNLKLIDRELKKKLQERADAIFLVIDYDLDDSSMIDYHHRLIEVLSTVISSANK